jgi:hypothetical protein
MVSPNTSSSRWPWIWAGFVLIALGLLLYIAISGAQPTLVLVPMADADGLAEAANGALGEEVAAGIDRATGNNWPLWISAMTLAVSVIGLVSSTLLTWRKEARDVHIDRLETERLRIEVEKMQLEIEQLRRAMATDE